MHSSLAGFIFYKGRNYLVVWGPISDRRRAEFTCWVSLFVVGLSFLKKGRLLNCWQFIFFIWVKPSCWSVAYPVLGRFSILPDLNFQQIEHIYQSCVFYRSCCTQGCLLQAHFLTVYARKTYSHSISGSIILLGIVAMHFFMYFS
jgi:hypothetical protein